MAKPLNFTFLFLSFFQKIFLPTLLYCSWHYAPSTHSLTPAQLDCENWTEDLGEADRRVKMRKKSWQQFQWKKGTIQNHEEDIVVTTVVRAPCRRGFQVNKFGAQKNIGTMTYVARITTTPVTLYRATVFGIAAFRTGTCTSALATVLKIRWRISASIFGAFHLKVLINFRRGFSTGNSSSKDATASISLKKSDSREAARNPKCKPIHFMPN